MLVKIFKYIEPLWTGTDGKISLKAVGAIALLIDFVSNAHQAVYKWAEGKSFEGLSLIAGIEMGGVAALLGLTMYGNLTSQKIDSQIANPPQEAAVKIQNVEKVTVEQPKIKVDNPDA